VTAKVITGIARVMTKVAKSPCVMTTADRKRPTAAKVADNYWSNARARKASSGAVANTRNVQQLTLTKTVNQILIFSLLKIRKKTSSIIAGILIGITCLWGISMWQDISPQQLLDMLLGSLVFIFGIMLLALMIIMAFKLLLKLIRPNKDDREND